MKKLDLDALVVESFATVEISQQVRGTVEGQQNGTSVPPGLTCWNTCEHTCKGTCPASCWDTDCVAACQGGGDISKDESCEGCGDTTGGSTMVLSCGCPNTE